MSPASPSVERNLIDVVGLKKYFPIRGGLFKRQVGAVRAVDGVTFYIRRGETLGLVGESGCGKTTVGRAIMMLARPTSGYVFMEAPKEVVKDFSELVELAASVNDGNLTKKDGADILQRIDRLLGSPACEIKDDKKTRYCRDASVLLKEIDGLTGSDHVGPKEDDIITLAEDSIEEVARRYCINYLKRGEVKWLRSRIQFVFQDPFSSLDPKMLIKSIVAEPLTAHKRHVRKRARQAMARTKDPQRKKEILDEYRREWGKQGIDQQITQLLEKVGLNVEHMYRYPHEFSGGQRQRIGIARALSVRPDFVVLDEPTSALDVSVQAQTLNMLNTLQNDFGLTYLFISHDLSTIKYMCDRVAVMYLGKIAEYAAKQELFAKPVHPYTEALLSVIPVPDPELKRDRIILPGDVPSPANPPPGCRFHTRCPLVTDICKEIEPSLIDIGNEHYVACHVRAPVAEILEQYRQGKTAGDQKTSKRP